MELHKSEPLLQVKDLKTYFPVYGGVLSTLQGYVHAVDCVSFDVYPGETLGVVGESGCGKTTMAQSIMRIVKATSGQVLYKGKDLLKFSPRQMREAHREIQIIFQDPFSSLDPRMSVGQIIEEPLIIHKVKDPEERKKRVLKVMDLVGLPSAYYNRYPHEFSGGQRQRISIARAIVLDAKIIFCDEPVSALDVSIQSKILNLLRDLQKELGLTFVFISHALNVVRHVSDRVCVMYLGKIMEIAPAEHIFEQAAHPYTQALLSAIPIPDPEKHRERILLAGDIPSPRNPPSGCRFHTRCPKATQRCACEEPPLVEYSPGHMVACHLCNPTVCKEACE